MTERRIENVKEYGEQKSKGSAPLTRWTALHALACEI